MDTTEIVTCTCQCKQPRRNGTLSYTSVRLASLMGEGSSQTHTGRAICRPSSCASGFPRPGAHLSPSLSGSAVGGRLTFLNLPSLAHCCLLLFPEIGQKKGHSHITANTWSSKRTQWRRSRRHRLPKQPRRPQTQSMEFLIHSWIIFGQRTERDSLLSLRELQVQRSFLRTRKLRPREVK